MVESRRAFLKRMEKKYHAYLAVARPRESKHAKVLELSRSSSSEERGVYVERDFLNKSEIELIFPGHINSYYASAEF